MGSMTSPSSCSVALRYLVRLHMGYPRTFPTAPFSYLEKGISRDIWSCDVVSASDIDLLRIFMCFCIIFVISAPFSHHFLLHYDGFCSFTATSHVTTTASEMLCTKAFQKTCGSVAAKRQKIKTVKTLTSVCVGLSVLTRFKVNIFPREQAPGQKYPPRILVSCETSHTS